MNRSEGKRSGPADRAFLDVSGFVLFQQGRPFPALSLHLTASLCFSLPNRFTNIGLYGVGTALRLCIFEFSVLLR